MSADEYRTSIRLGSEDSATSSDSESISSGHADESLSFCNASEGETVSLEQNNEYQGYGNFTEDGYIHNDGREETWYRQENWTTINPGPRGPPADFVPGELMQRDDPDSKAYPEIAAPAPVVGGEEQVASEMARLEHEADNPAGNVECTCASSNLPRNYDDVPFFDHENGWWVDPGANDPARTTFRFTPSSTKEEKQKKKRKLEDLEKGVGPSNDSNVPLALSSQVVVPSCDLHYPITDILHDTTQFIAGSRFLKLKICTTEITPSASAADEEDLSNLVTESAATHPTADNRTIMASVRGRNTAQSKHQSFADDMVTSTSEGISTEGATSDCILSAHHHRGDAVPGPNTTSTAQRPDPIPSYIQDESGANDASTSSPSTLSDSRDGEEEDNDYNGDDDGGSRNLTTTHYIDQAHKLRLIATDPRNPSQRKMNIHAPPADWGCRRSITKLNRWRNGFRERRRASAASAATEDTTGQPKTQQQKRAMWSAEELDTLRDNIVEQLRSNGCWNVRTVMRELEKKWPERNRTNAAVQLTVARYKLLDQARMIMYGGEPDHKEQATEEAENGEADVEDNDDEFDFEEGFEEDMELDEELDEDGAEEDEVLFGGRQASEPAAVEGSDTDMHLGTKLTTEVRAPTTEATLDTPTTEGSMGDLQGVHLG